MTTPEYEDVIKKIRDLEAAHAHLREEISLLNAWGRDCPPPRRALEGPETPIQSVVPRDRTLELMESYYTNILESMGQAVIAYDLDRRIFYWNQHAEKLFDCSREEALGNDVLSILINPNLYDLAFNIINGVKQGMSWVGQFPVDLQTGKKLLVILSLDPFYDDDGTLVGLVAVLVDSKPYFEIKYPVSEARPIDSDQFFGHSRRIITSKLGLNPEQPLQTAIASKLTTLATKISNKVRSKMKIDNEDDGNPIEASTPIKDMMSSFGTFFKDVMVQRESNDEGEEKNVLHKITSKAQALVQKRATQ